MKTQNKPKKYLFACGILSAILIASSLNAQEGSPETNNPSGNEAIYICIPKQAFENLISEEKDKTPSYYLYGEDGKLAEVKTNIDNNALPFRGMCSDKKTQCGVNGGMTSVQQSKGMPHGNQNRDGFRMPPMMHPPMDNKFVLLTVSEFDKLNEQKIERMKQSISDRIQKSIKQAEEHAIEANVDGKDAKVLFIIPPAAPLSEQR